MQEVRHSQKSVDVVYKTVPESNPVHHSVRNKTTLSFFGEIIKNVLILLRFYTHQNTVVFYSIPDMEKQKFPSKYFTVTCPCSCHIGRNFLKTIIETGFPLKNYF